MFEECDSLANIVVDDDNPQYSSVDGNLYNKEKTTFIRYAIGKPDTTFSMPSGVTAMGVAAFAHAKNLKSVHIPDGVTDIAESAFFACVNLEEISLPDSVFHIARFAFRCCNSLTQITLPKDLVQLGEDAFGCCENLSFYMKKGGLGAGCAEMCGIPVQLV